MSEQYKENVGWQTNYQRERESNTIVLAKWIPILFYLMVATTIVGVINNQLLVRFFPQIVLLGRILKSACLFAYGFVLLQLSLESEHYKIAGICTLVIASGNFMMALLPILAVSFTIPIAILGILVTYQEYQGHAQLLVNFDSMLANKWNALWRWYLVTLAITLGSILVAIIPIFGTLVLFVGIVGSFCISLLKMMYLYKMVQVFR